MCRGLALSQLLALVIASILLPIRSSTVREREYVSLLSPSSRAAHFSTSPQKHSQKIWSSSHPLEFDVYSLIRQHLTANGLSGAAAGLIFPLFLPGFGVGPGGPTSIRCEENYLNRLLVCRGKKKIFSGQMTGFNRSEWSSKSGNVVLCGRRELRSRKNMFTSHFVQLQHRANPFITKWGIWRQRCVAL